MDIGALVVLGRRGVIAERGNIRASTTRATPRVYDDGEERDISHSFTTLRLLPVLIILFLQCSLKPTASKSSATP